MSGDDLYAGCGDCWFDHGYLCGWLYAKLVFFFLTKSEVICQKQGYFGMRFSSRWSVFV